MDHMLPNGKTPDDLIKEMVEDLAGDLERYDDGVLFARVTPIEHGWRDGFIPFTNGGWDGRAVVSFQSGKHRWDCLKPCEEHDFKLMVEGFKEDFKDKLGPEKWTEDLEDEDPEALFSRILHHEDLNPDQPELFSLKEIGYQPSKNPAEKWREEWEQADEDVFFLDFRAIYYAASNHRNVTGEDEVYFFAAVNVDFNYGRDHVSYAGGNCHRGEWSRTVKLSEITSELLQEIKDQMLKALNDA